MMVSLDRVLAHYGVSVVIINPLARRTVRLGDDDDSGLDVGETLPGSHDLWFHELENASFDDSRRASFATKKLLYAASLHS